MNLNYLYYFKVLAETEHYTHAATLLKITQPSLSHAIHCLEEELNAYLFEKQGKYSSEIFASDVYSKNIVSISEFLLSLKSIEELYVKVSNTS